MGTVIKHPAPDQVEPSFAIFDTRVRMSKIINDGITRSGAGCFIAVSKINMTTVGVKGLTFCNFRVRQQSLLLAN